MHVYSSSVGLKISVVVDLRATALVVHAQPSGAKGVLINRRAESTVAGRFRARRTGRIYRDGVILGHVTSGAFAYNLGRSVALGLVNFERGTSLASVRSSTYQIEIAGLKFDATPSVRPLCDAKGGRISG